VKIDHGYFWLSAFWAGLAALGCACNVVLFLEDIRKNKGVLNKVHTNGIINAIESPPPERRELDLSNEDYNAKLREYYQNDNARTSLKKSLARRTSK
jgi:hypothetical protein